MSRRSRKQLALVAVALGVVAVPAAAPPAASAFDPLKQVCGVVGFFSGALGKACSIARDGGRLLSAGKKLVTGHLGGAAKTVLGDTGSAVASSVTTHLALAALVLWVVGGAKFALDQTADVIGRTTTPRLGSLWFSSTYWRVAAIAALLTLPFLFAATVQAMLGSDLALVLRAAFGYLPLAALAVGIAAPLTMLLLSASDELSAIVASAAGGASTHFLALAQAGIGAASLAARSPFLVFFAALLTVGTAVVLWLELLMRAAAVYVIVLMLPLAFAAMVWPARRVWATRSIELLVALILSKFAIVAVLSLGGAAVSESAVHSPTGLIAGVTLLGLAICAPWALLRLLPLAELASGAVSTLHGESGTAAGHFWRVRNSAGAAEGGSPPQQPDPPADWAAATTSQMRQEHDASEAAAPGDPEQSGPEQSGPEAQGAEAGALDGVAATDTATPATDTATPATDTATHAPTPATPAASDPTAPAEPPASPTPPRPWEADDLTLDPLVLGPNADWLEGLRQPPAPPEDGFPPEDGA